MRKIKKIIGTVVGSAAGLTLANAPMVQAVELGEFERPASEVADISGTKVSIKGFIKFDALMSDYTDGSLASNNLGRDFYIPSLTPVGGDSQTTQFDMHIKTSRFGIGTSTMVNGKALKTYIEMDFAVGDNGDERISNSYQNRIRHAYLVYDKWLLGQAWSTFMNVSSLPDSVDFIGNTDAGTFGRQVMVRYTNGPWQFAIENPESVITPNGGGRIISDDNSLPDFVARYNLKNDNLNMSFIGLARQLTYDNGAEIDDSVMSYGLSITGTAKLGGKDDLKFGVNTGAGMGRYIGLNIANGAVVDGNNELETIDSTGVFAAYRHFWNDKWRSSFIYSRIDIDNDTDLTGTTVSKESERAAVNLIYQAAPKLKFGGEISRANREIESGADGSMNRLQFTAVMSF